MRNKLLLLADAELELDARQHDEPPAKYRSNAERDRDRVLYSSALQRLGRVTQVTASEEGLSFHSRLTHSFKVAQFARRLAERFQRECADDPTTYDKLASQAIAALDADAAEAAALAHDLGHPPFGHLAEAALNNAVAPHGGFEGNAQSFRIVTRLAQRDATYQGLNLTRRTLNGILKYPWQHDSEDRKAAKKWNYYPSDVEAFEWARQGIHSKDRTLEAEIMDWADDVTYAIHDMDDFYRAGLVPLDRLTAGDPDRPGVELDAFIAHLKRKADTPEKADAWADSAERLFVRGPLSGAVVGPYSGTQEQRIALRAAGSGFINQYLNAPKIESDGSGAYFEVSERVRHQVDVLKELIWFYVIDRPTLGILQSGQRATITGLYRVYHEAITSMDLRLFPPLVGERINQAIADELPSDRAIVDYIASLTEESASSIYRRLSGMANGSIADAAGRLT